jgi:CheY-like chemotaxis protein
MSMKKLILLIDDDHEELLILQEALSLAGVFNQCQWATSAEEAVNMLQQLLPDFIFIDINMPRCNGLECLSTIRSMHLSQQAKVIMYSTCINPQTKTIAQQQGALCLEKQASLHKLAQQLLKLVA